MHVPSLGFPLLGQAQTKVLKKKKKEKKKTRKKILILQVVRNKIYIVFFSPLGTKKKGKNPIDVTGDILSEVNGQTSAMQILLQVKRH